MPDKYQEEIEEILRGLGEKAPPRKGGSEQPVKPPDDAPLVARQVASSQHPQRGRVWPTITPGKLAIIGILVFLLGAVWVRPLIWVGLSFLVGAYLLVFIKPRSISQDKRWRGKSVEEEQSPWEKLKSWLKS